MWVYYTIILGIALYGVTWADPYLWEKIGALALGYGSIALILAVIYVGWILEQRIKRAKQAKYIAEVSQRVFRSGGG